MYYIDTIEIALLQSKFKTTNKTTNKHMSDKPNAPKTNKPTATAAAANPPAQPKLKKGPSPVFSIPATKTDKEYIALQSTRTGKSQKELLTMAINLARTAINALPKYVEPVVEVKAKAKKADEAEKALAGAAGAPAATAGK